MKGGLRWPSFCTRDRRSDRRSSSFRATDDDLMADKRERHTPCFREQGESGLVVLVCRGPKGLTSWSLNVCSKRVECVCAVDSEDKGRRR